ncbi:IS200/IS605 family transposase [Cytophaga aurantiaca]|uniref:IS200/IS605 family transposase n=1 Tax=Cytophaga aurantiaca TaxID=29530 RepID=UPI00037EA97B|nr:IS200/IS605 family transposase [Cytophaga aurantiaca]
MANTYAQLYIQTIFAVKYREGTIASYWKDELYQYITGIVRNNKHKLISINGMSDHIHILISIHPTQSVSDLIQEVKASSSKWINDKKFIKGRFEWQSGYGAFSYSRSQIKVVAAYIENQEKHHAKKTFKEEYIEFLQKFEIEYDEKFIFKDLI